MTIDWANAPEGATHWHDAISTWYKIADDSVFYSNYRDVWVFSAYEISDINLSQGFIPRPTSTAIPELKKLTQAVFDGLPKEYRWAIVDSNQSCWVSSKKPERTDECQWIFGNVSVASLKSVGGAFDATDWQNSKIEREPSVAEIVEAFAANPPNSDDLIKSVANAQTLAEAQAEIEQLRAEIDRLNKACDQRAAHEYKLMGDVGMLAAINSELLAGLESMLDEHQALTSSAFKLHGDIRALIAKARGDL